ncbi:hypothetical protein HKX48_001577 [Thoreauomyces humboldtii]|nr:hypothetical protein HKX48_001577 [Thoreauomyces humboldtii]
MLPTSVGGQQYCLVPEGYTPVMVPNGQPSPFTPGFPFCLQAPVPTSATPRPVPKAAVPKRIPRPSNSFMTYRMDKQHEVLATNEGANNKDISVIIGEMWRNESEPIKDYYRKKAELGRKEHAIRYPNYKYVALKKRSTEDNPSRKRALSEDHVHDHDQDRETDGNLSEEDGSEMAGDVSAEAVENPTIASLPVPTPITTRAKRAKKTAAPAPPVPTPAASRRPSKAKPKTTKPVSKGPKRAVSAQTSPPPSSPSACATVTSLSTPTPLDTEPEDHDPYFLSLESEDFTGSLLLESPICSPRDEVAVGSHGDFTV